MFRMRWKYYDLVLLCALLLQPLYGHAFTVSTEVPGSLAPMRQHDAFEVTPSLMHYARREPLPAPQARLMATFFQRFTNNWQVAWDERSDRPHLIQGVGVPLLPGAGNKLQMADLGLPAGQSLDMDLVEQQLRQFINAYMPLFRVAQQDLRRHPDSTAYGPDARLWLVDFEVLHQGIPIRGAKVFFRINHGNIVQFGTELVGDIALDVRPRVSGPEAATRVLQDAGVGSPTAVDVLNGGVLKIYPALTASERPGKRYSGPQGAGYTYRLVREVDFRLPGDGRTYRGVIDAQSGALLELLDLTQYIAAEVSGGIYPMTNSDPEEVRPFATTSVSNHGSQVTDQDGLYNYTGGLAFAGLRGPLVKTNDTCGFSLATHFRDGNIDFGTSDGTDCTTPGVGGPGNTHASRNSLYHLTSIKHTAMELLPTNTWLQATLRANTNRRSACNAFWNGESVNFFRSSDVCSNTGEIAAVLYHEWGHGLDENTGGAASDGGSGEAVGDTFAFLQTQHSCIGSNFQPGVPCHNCGSTGCTGVRDLRPFASGGAATIARPDTVTDSAGIDCDRFRCPATCRGPMGYECHCESYIASTAIYDLTQLLGFDAMQDLWYGSLFPTKSAYQVVEGGTCNPAAQVDGCGASNWYTVFLAIDDDDGNLANGSPNACRIWDAFDAHGIACGSRPVCTR